MTETEKLEPCPFCGGNVRIKDRPFSGGGGGVFVGHEDDTGCRAKTLGFHPDPATAIAAWNHRATPDVDAAVAAERARIRAKVEELHDLAAENQIPFGDPYFVGAKVYLDMALTAIDAGEPKEESTVNTPLREIAQRQREWSERTFGPGQRTAGILNHIRKELDEIAADPADVVEWADLMILAMDGAWRAGHSPEALVLAILGKSKENQARLWPDWRDVPEDEPIEHIREDE